MDTLRQMSLEQSYQPEPAVYALHRSFLDNIKLWGRVHELTMLMEYKIRCLLMRYSLFFQGLFSDLKLGGALMLKGKITLLPERIKRLKEIQNLYEKTGPSGNQEER